MTITIGSDPEFFLRRNGRYVSSIGKIGGSKEFPAPLEREGFFIQEDNVAVEFNIPPADEVEKFVASIEWTISHIRDKISPYGYTAAFDASANFDEAELSHPKAL